MQYKGILLATPGAESWFVEQLPGLPADLVLPEHMDDVEWPALPGFDQLLAQVLVAHDPRNPCHNRLRAGRSVILARDVFRWLRGHGVEFPRGLEEVVLLAIAARGLGHPGAAFLSDAKPGRVDRPGLGVAVEWRAAAILDRLAAAKGWSVSQRLVARNVVWATTAGGSTDRGRALGLDRVQPKGLFERLALAVDACQPLETSAGFHEHTSAVYGESSIVPRAGSQEEWIDVRSRYLTTCEGHIVRLDEMLDALVAAVRGPDVVVKSACTALGWREALETQRAAAEAVLHDPVERALLIAELALANTSLEGLPDVRKLPAPLRLTTTSPVAVLQSAVCGEAADLAERDSRSSAEQAEHRAAYLAEVRELVDRHGGRVLRPKRIGVVAVFDLPKAAVACARAIAKVAWDDEEQPSCVGLAFGETTFDHDVSGYGRPTMEAACIVGSYVGPGVHVTEELLERVDEESTGSFTLSFGMTGFLEAFTLEAEQPAQ